MASVGGGRTSIPIEDASQLGHGVEQGLGHGREGIAIMTDPAVLVSE